MSRRFALSGVEVPPRPWWLSVPVFLGGRCCLLLGVVEGSPGVLFLAPRFFFVALVGVVGVASRLSWWGPIAGRGGGAVLLMWLLALLCCSPSLASVAGSSCGPLGPRPPSPSAGFFFCATVSPPADCVVSASA